MLYALRGAFIQYQLVLSGLSITLHTPSAGPCSSQPFSPPHDHQDRLTPGNPRRYQEEEEVVFTVHRE